MQCITPQDSDTIHPMKNKIPPPIVLALFGLLIYLEDKYFFVSITAELDHQRIYTLCVAIVGFCIIALGMLEFHKAKTSVNPLKLDKSSTVVNSGIYRFTRNPMYLGLVILLIAFCVKLGDVFGLIFIVPLFIWYMTMLQIKPEEEAMSKLFGAEYEIYKGKVRRWL